MKVTDVLFALISGRIIAFLAEDFLIEWGIQTNFYVHLIIWVAFPFFSLFCLWVAFLIGRKFLFVYQIAKFLLVGAVATIVDLEVFEILNWALAFFAVASLLFMKGLSFLVATLLKYFGNKYWAFLKHGKENMKKEIAQFFFITVIGLAIDVIAFHYFANIMGPSWGISNVLWVKLSVVFAGIVAAFWNFSGYKFWVFKK